MNRLSARTVSTITQPGRYADGGGLYLAVSPSGARSWIFRYRFGKFVKDIGLGGVQTVSLKEAREHASVARKKVQSGEDPSLKKALKAARDGKTFSECAAEFIAAHEAGWRNPKHRQQWRNTLVTYVDPILGKTPVASIGTNDVRKVLQPLWNQKPEAASRIRGRIEAILDWAAVGGYRDSENPARWRGHLKHVLPPVQKVRKVRHHPALPFGDVPAFVSTLRTRAGMAAMALEFAILTASRTGEVIGARWPEIDFRRKVWTVPAERMKAAVEHQVPLSSRAMDILNSLDGNTEYIFQPTEAQEPLSNMSLLAVLKRMGRTDLTTHGFRSTFRDWAAEETDFANEIVEMALAHKIKNKAEAAYRRGNLLEKRRELMAAWNAYCG